MRKRRNSKGKKPKKSGEINFYDRNNNEGKYLIYFECRKKCHIKPNCPLFKKRKGKFEKKKKTLKAETQSDTESKSSNDE